MKRIVLYSAGALLISGAAFAQYSLNKQRIAGGGGASTGGTYALTGTIGQSEAGGPMTGAGYALTSGYWSAVIPVQDPGGPVLTITKNPNQSMTIRWPSPSPGLILQQSANLTSWTNSTYPVSDDGTFRSVNFTPPGGRLFFRLARP